MRDGFPVSAEARGAAPYKSSALGDRLRTLPSAGASAGMGGSWAGWFWSSRGSPTRACRSSRGPSADRPRFPQPLGPARPDGADRVHPPKVIRAAAEADRIAEDFRQHFRALKPVRPVPPPPTLAAPVPGTEGVLRRMIDARTIRAVGPGALMRLVEGGPYKARTKSRPVGTGPRRTGMRMPYRAASPRDRKTSHPRRSVSVRSSLDLDIAGAFDRSRPSGWTSHSCRSSEIAKSSRSFFPLVPYRPETKRQHMGLRSHIPGEHRVLRPTDGIKHDPVICTQLTFCHQSLQRT